MRRPLFVLLCLMFVSCDLRKRSEEDLLNLYRQRILESNYVLYEFEYESQFVSHSNYKGVTILDSTVNFEWDNIVEIPPFLYFNNTPNGTTFDATKIRWYTRTSLPKDTSLLPIQTFDADFNGNNFSITEYQVTYGSPTTSSGLMRYKIDSVIESQDSLTFLGVDKIFGGRRFPSIASFHKGNIKQFDRGDSIFCIQVSEPVIGRGPIYTVDSPFDLIQNRPIVNAVTFEFYPTQRIDKNQLSDYGIWKRVN